jgi:hypothetical protein
VKVLPTRSVDWMVLSVRTTRVVPAGIVAANEPATHAQVVIAVTMNVFLVIGFPG